MAFEPLNTFPQARLDAIQGRRGLLVADISGGLEPNVPIPLFNEFDGREGLDPGFEYANDYVWAKGVEAQVKEVVELEADKMRQHVMHETTRGCGIALNALVRELWMILCRLLYSPVTYLPKSQRPRIPCLDRWMQIRKMDFEWLQTSRVSQNRDLTEDFLWGDWLYKDMSIK